MPNSFLNEDGTYSIPIYRDSGTTIFTFSEIERFRKTEFNAFVQVAIHHEKDLKSFSGRVNLASLSGREGFVRSLQRIAKGEKEFDSIFSEAIELLTIAINSLPRSLPVTEIDPSSGNMMLFAPFITDKSANLVFGDGSSTKSYICIHLAICLVSGLPFAGFKPSRKCNVLFLDYEDVGGKFSDRVNRIAGGMATAPAIEDLANLRYMKANGVALSEMVPLLKEEVLKYNIELLVIDSAAYACGAEIEKADAVIRYFNALEKLNVASLAIAHVPKGSVEQERGQLHAIGSIYFHNGPRNTWNVVKLGDDTDSDQIKKICMFHRKCNDGPLNRLIPLEVDFSDQKVTRIRLGDERDWEEARDLGSRIMGYLRTGLKSRNQIEEELDGQSKESIKTAIRRLKTRGKIKQLGGDKGDYILTEKS